MSNQLKQFCLMTTPVNVLTKQHQHQNKPDKTWRLFRNLTLLSPVLHQDREHTGYTCSVQSCTQCTAPHPATQKHKEAKVNGGCYISRYILLNMLWNGSNWIRGEPYIFGAVWIGVVVEVTLPTLTAKWLQGFPQSKNIGEIILEDSTHCITDCMSHQIIKQWKGTLFQEVHGNMQNRQESCHSVHNWTSHFQQLYPENDNFIFSLHNFLEFNQTLNQLCTFETKIVNCKLDTANLEVNAAIFHYSLCQCRDVDSSITFACEEDLIFLVFWEKPEEFLKGKVVIHRHLEQYRTIYMNFNAWTMN